ncbi:MAG TPA: hypothetical protein DCY13_00085 [Verrucomicrobiales bacterium]|nr:hypothetical protein [Verrucomicrobiales bacterium]
MATEAEILGSWDLVTAVVSAIGAERILGETGLTNAALAAAAQVRQNLKVELAGKGSVITLTYSNLRPDVPQVVLEEIVKQYRERHIMAHSSEGSYDSLLRETDAMSARIKETQTKLTDLKVRLGVTTLAETKTQLSGQIVALETDIVRIRAQLAESEARFAELQRGRLGDADTNAPVVLPAPVDPAVVEQYRGAGLRLDRQRLQELELVGQYADAHPQVRQIREQIAATEREKRTLEEAHPGLLVVRSELAGADSARAAVVDHSRERAAIAASRAHLQSLETRLDELNNRRSEISASENELADLERGLQLDERSYEQSLIALRGARFNEALDPSKMPNINVLQNPTVPLRAAGKRAKTCGAVAVAGLAIGMGLAFLREVVFDQSIRSPLEIENRLHLPMFLSIPLLSDRQPVKLLGSGAAQEDADHAPQPERAPWEISHFIRPYCDALRDRLIMYFQLKNIHHKPKLVAVTSCSEGAGTTTVAAALAASLSETGDGKVLLVDMNVGRPEMHPFFRGNLASSLTDLFQTGGDTQQGRYDNLYLATGTERNGELTPLVPAKFYELLPRMRSSDFDYIIFDMPPIRQTSATVALSGLMDKVLLLVEPGKTNRDAVKRATDLMRQQHADVAGVVNRLPKSSLKWLQPELE